MKNGEGIHWILLLLLIAVHNLSLEKGLVA